MSGRAEGARGPAGSPTSAHTSHDYLVFDTCTPSTLLADARGDLARSLLVMGLRGPVPYNDALRVLWRIRPRMNKRTGRLSIPDTTYTRSARVILSRSIRRLEARGLVERTRRSHYQLTDTGRALAASLHSDQGRPAQC
jgi:hypothetical protein